MDVAIIAATEQELQMLIEGSSARPESSLGVRKIHAGRVGRHEVALCVSGMGKINAAAAAACVLEKFSPRLLVSTGIAGAFPAAGLAVGDLAAATAEICADEGVLTPQGWQPYEFIGIPAVERKGARYYNEFPLSVAPAAAAAHLASALGIPLKRGKFLTVSTCSGTALRAAELYGRYQPVAETMEGGAVAQVALQYGVDCLEIRGISNIVEDRDLSRWNIVAAAEQAQRFLLKFLQKTE